MILTLLLSADHAANLTAASFKQECLTSSATCWLLLGAVTSVQRCSWVPAGGAAGAHRLSKAQHQEEDESSSGSLDHPGLAAPRRQRQAAGSRPASARTDAPKDRLTV